jgi:hypothetical protein
MNSKHPTSGVLLISHDMYGVSKKSKSVLFTCDGTITVFGKTRYTRLVLKVASRRGCALSRCVGANPGHKSLRDFREAQG